MTSKNLILILGLLIVSCNSQSENDCKDAIIFDKMEELSYYNSTFYDDQYSGIVTARSDTDSTIIEKNLFYEDGELIRYESYYANGDVKMVIPLKCNSRHGTFFYYYPNGQIGYEVPYKLGRKDGRALSYDSLGYLIRVVNFKNDEKNGPSYSINNDRDTVNFKLYKDGQLQ
jgi:antitoxin component YwqK of YwqJK toxin-antitoxin module